MTSQGLNSFITDIVALFVASALWCSAMDGAGMRFTMSAHSLNGALTLAASPGVSNPSPSCISEQVVVQNPAVSDER